MKIACITVVAVTLSLAAPVAAADTPAPFPEFTFKMGKPPPPGTTKRITVQIQPDDQPAPKPKPKVADPETPDVTVASSYDWFWREIPPGYSDEGVIRMEAALNHLSKPPAGVAVPRPRLQALQDIALAQGQNILTATIGTNVSPALVLAVISVESGGRRDALSPKGAQGLMQLIPATAERFGVTDSLSEAQNIKGGVAYLDWLLKEFDGDPILALAGYNAGENAVKTNKGVPPYAETRDYIPKVLAAYDVARGLCKTRPEFISDGCALNLALN
jgi:soluble lytic murein transglycosylase-like protein